MLNGRPSPISGSSFRYVSRGRIGLRNPTLGSRLRADASEGALSDASLSDCVTEPFDPVERKALVMEDARSFLESDLRLIFSTGVRYWHLYAC